MTSSSPDERSLLARARSLAPGDWLDIGIATLELARARLKLRGTSAERLLELVDTRAQMQPPHAATIERVRTAIARTSHRVPWRADCLVQAIAAQHWLRRHGLASRISIGVRDRGANPFEAHAWLVCGDTVVTGGSVEDYSQLRSPVL